MSKIKVENILNGEDINKVFEENKYFPMNLLVNDECPLHFVLGVRGDGKTYNAKKQILKDWYEKGIKSYWIVPTKTEMEEMVATKDFHLDMLLDTENDEGEQYSDEDLIDIYNESDVQAHKNALRTKMDKEFLLDNDGEWFMRVIPLSMYHKYKKGKHPKVHRMYFDEFMRETYLTNEAFKTMDLIVSVQREKKDFKMTFLGNAISLNHPMFVSLGIYKVDKESVITILKNQRTGEPLAKIWNWKRPEEDSEEKNAGLLWYELGEATGYNDYAVKNEFKNDNMDNIVPPDEIDKNVLRHTHTLDLGEVMVDLFFIHKDDNSTGQGIYYLKATKDKDAKLRVKYAIHQDYVRDNVIFKRELGENLIKRIQKNIIYYDSVVSKQALWKIIKKYA